MLKAVSMFGVTNSKELLLRAQLQGVPVSEAFFAANKWRNLNACADALESEYPVWVSGSNVLPKENGWYFIDYTKPTIKLQSTIQPKAFVTLPITGDTPNTEALVNDLCASGLYRVWG